MPGLAAQQIAQALANLMHRSQRQAIDSQSQPPEAETTGEGRAEFTIDTPVGRFRVDVTEIA